MKKQTPEQIKRAAKKCKHFQDLWNNPDLTDQQRSNVELTLFSTTRKLILKCETL